MTRALLAALLVAVVGCGPNVLAPPSSTASVALASPTPTSSAAPTTAAPSPTSTARYVDPILGYSVTTPASWRVSGCLSRIYLNDPVSVGETSFTWRTVAEEQDLGVSGGTGATGALAWIIVVEVEISTETGPERAAHSNNGLGVAIDATTIDGRPAARVTDSYTNTVSYYVANGGRVYAISIVPGFETRPAQVTNATVDALARSMTFMTPTARPTATPVPVDTAAVQAVADAVAAAFAASDADRLHDLMPPKCWFNYGYYQSEGGATSRDKFAAGLRDSFSQGLQVTVEPRPIMTKPPMPGSFWIWSTWSAYGTPPRTTPKSNVQLVFDQIDGRWYWIGALFNATR